MEFKISAIVQAVSKCTTTYTMPCTNKIRNSSHTWNIHLSILLYTITICNTKWGWMTSQQCTVNYKSPSRSHQTFIFWGKPGSTRLTACQSTRIGLKTTYSSDVFFPDYSETQGSYFWISGSHRSQWPSIFLHLLLSCLSFLCHYLSCDREAICLNTVQTTEKVSWPPWLPLKPASNTALNAVLRNNWR